MSAYQINKLCHRVFHDVAFREAVKSDPASAIADWPFTDAERKALLEGDIRRLYEWGTHPFLLAHFTRWACSASHLPCMPSASRAPATRTEKDIDKKQWPRSIASVFPPITSPAIP